MSLIAGTGRCGLRSWTADFGVSVMVAIVPSDWETSMFQGHSVMVGGLLAMCEVTLSRDRNHMGEW